MIKDYRTCAGFCKHAGCSTGFGDLQFNDGHDIIWELLKQCILLLAPAWAHSVDNGLQHSLDEELFDVTLLVKVRNFMCLEPDPIARL